MNEQQTKVDWRQNNQSIKSSLDYISTAVVDKYHDIVFIVGHGENKENIFAHKFILYLRSIEFENVFLMHKNEEVHCSSPTGDDDNPEFQGKQVINLPKINAKPFRILLKYVYTDTIVVEELDDVLDLFLMAQRFRLARVSGHCFEMMKRRLDNSNAIKIYEYANEHHLEELATKSLKIILANAKSVIGSPEFLQMSHASLCTILQNDFLEIEELALFQRLVSWAKEECKRFELEENPENLCYVMKSCLYFIRFPLMNPIDFVNYVKPTEILDKECVDKLQTFFILKSELNDDEASKWTVGTEFCCKKRGSIANGPISSRDMRTDPTIQALNEYHFSTPPLPNSKSVQQNLAPTRPPVPSHKPHPEYLFAAASPPPQGLPPNVPPRTHGQMSPFTISYPHPQALQLAPGSDNSNSQFYLNINTSPVSLQSQIIQQNQEFPTPQPGYRYAPSAPVLTLPHVTPSPQPDAKGKSHKE